MSTKIYNGYRLTEGADLWALVNRLRTQADIVRDELDQAALDKLSNAAFKPGQTRKQTLYAALEVWEKLMAKLGENTYGHDPYRLEVVFLHDDVTGLVLALLYCETPQLQEVWESQPEVEEYGYWDNTDWPEGMTEEEWNERGEAWDRALGWDAPVRRGLTFQLRPTPSDGMFELIRKADD